MMNVEGELKTYLKVLWRYKWMIAACAAVSAIVALVVSFQLTPIYKATATMRVATAAIGASDYTYIASATRLSNTYVEIATSDISLNEVAKRVGGEVTQKNVEVEIVPETELIKFSATDPDPARASNIANALAYLMIEQSAQLYGGSALSAREILEEQLKQAKLDLDTVVAEYDNALRSLAVETKPVLITPAATASVVNTPLPNPNLDTMARLVSVRQNLYSDLLQRYETARTNEQLRFNSITIVEPAYLPKKPDSPQIPLNTVLGLAAGLMMGVILAFVFEGMNDTLRDIDEVQAITSLPILGRVPELNHKFGFDRPTVPAFDQLSAHLTLINGKQAATAYLITSPEPSAGKSTVAANLAFTLAHECNRVVLVDMDFRRPRIHSIMNLPNEKGLSDFLWGNISLGEALQNTKQTDLRVITAGSSSDVPDNWMMPGKISRLLETLGKESDYVLIDAPALLSVADPMILASQVNSVILVVALRKTERKNLRFSLQQLNELKAKVVGIVINRMPKSPMYSYYTNRFGKNGSQPGRKKEQAWLQGSQKRSS